MPVPDPGISREWVDAAREAIKDNRRHLSTGRRFWELSGGIMFCAGCGRGMATHAVRSNGGRSKTLHFYYRCQLRKSEGKDACGQAKSYRADEIEARVWTVVSGVFGDPDQLRADLERMIDLEREVMRGDPEREAKAWLDKLTEVDQERRGYQRLAAKGRMTDGELDEALAELEETRATAERELEALKSRREHLESLERDKEALLETYATLAPKALGSLTPEERYQLYKMLRLRVVVNLDETLNIGGTLADGLGVCPSEATL